MLSENDVNYDHQRIIKQKELVRLIYDVQINHVQSIHTIYTMIYTFNERVQVDLTI